jgi:hypothetical protein
MIERSARVRLFGDRCPTCERISVTFDGDGRPESGIEQRPDAATA